MSTLPTQRDYRAVMLMAPAVHPTGPSGSFSVAGSMSFENLYMVNGVSVNENLRGQAQDLVIEDAIQETTVATAGVSAEFGRFGGGVVNIVSKSGGNLFTRLVPRDDDQRQLARARAEARRRSVCQRHEARRRRADARIHGRRPGDQRPSVVLHCRTAADELDQPPAGDHEHPLRLHRQVAPVRGQGDLCASMRTTASRAPTPRSTATRPTARSTRRRRWTWPACTTAACPRICSPSTTRACITPSFFLEGRYSQRNLTFVGSGSKFTDIQKGTLLVDLAGRRYNAPTFCGVCTDEERDNQDIFVKGSYFLSTAGSGSHNLVRRLRLLQRRAARQQLSVGQQLSPDQRARRSSRART